MEITLKELAEEFDLSLSHLAQLIRRGILPPGRKEGKYRIMPADECRLIMRRHTVGEFWLIGICRAVRENGKSCKCHANKVKECKRCRERKTAKRMQKRVQPTARYEARIMNAIS